MPDFGFTFSTGSVIDSMVVSGTVLNAANLEPVKGMLVGMHSNLADSAFTTIPFERVGRTDSRGRFTIRGVAPGEYRIYGLQDADQNFYYSQPTEMIAFEDSLIIPAMDERTRLDTLWKDSLTIDTIMERAYTHFLRMTLYCAVLKNGFCRNVSSGANVPNPGNSLSISLLRLTACRC